MLVTARARRARVEPLLRVWVGAAGGLLLIQGALSLAVDLSGVLLPPLAQAFVGDPRHALLHVGWGALMLALLTRGADRQALARLSLVFGGFYVALAVLGVAVHYPFGLVLGPGENAFHFLVGPISLLMGIWGMTSLESAVGRG